MRDDAVQFGATAGTLIVDPRAVFNGQVAADATFDDVLELSGRQSGGTSITLGTQFTGFSTRKFAAGAKWTAAATTADSTAHALHIDGFAIGDVRQRIHTQVSRLPVDTSDGSSLDRGFYVNW